MIRESRTKWLTVLAFLALSILFTAKTYASNTVYWETAYDPKAKQLTVKVTPPTPLKEVYCELFLADETNKVVGKRVLQITGATQKILPKGKETSKTFDFDTKGASISDVSRLFGKPILSSPKAAESGLIDGLKVGIPTSVHRSL